MAILFAWSASAQAATVLVGSPMTNPNLAPGTIGDTSQTQTIANVALSEAGAHAASPVDGTIINWTVSTNGTGDYGLRILHPTGSGEYVGGARVGQDVTTAAVHTFTANVPIQAGDLIGIDIPPNNGVTAFTPDTGSSWVAWDPALPVGSTSAPNPIFTETNSELAYNAVVQYPDPPATTTPKTGTTKKKCKKSKKHKRSAESAKKKKCKKKHR